MIFGTDGDDSVSIPTTPVDKSVLANLNLHPKKKSKCDRDKEIINEFADFFISEFDIKTIIEEKNKRIWIFQNGYYHPFGESVIRTEADKQDYDANKILAKIRARASVWRKEFEKEADPNFSFANLKNCVRDWKDGRSYEHDSKYRFRYKLPFDYEGSGATCPRFDEMVNNMLKNKEDVVELKKWLGYHLIEGTGYQKAAFFVGPPGSNKGTLLKVLIKIVGDGNYSAATLQSLCNTNLYSAADLENKLANLCGDLTTDRFTTRELGMYYRITGEDPIQGRKIAHDPRTFKPRAKLTWLFNKLPILTVGVFNANEFWRRCIIFETKAYDYYQDPYFEYKLYEELPGIYNNYFEEGARLLHRNHFKDTKGSDGNYGELRKKWLLNMRRQGENEDVLPIISEGEVVEDDLE